MASAIESAAASSTITTSTAASFHPPPSHRILEITLISAQDLAPVSKSQRTYALIWINSNKKRSTSVDPKGHTNPTWNHKFSFRVDDEFLNSRTAAVNVEIYAVAWFRDVLVGSVRINISNLLAPPARNTGQQGNNNDKNERFMALQIRRPSDDPQGMLNMGVALFDSAARGGKPVCSEVSASASDCRDILDKKMSKFLTDVEITEDFPEKQGSVVNGSVVCGGSEVYSDIGPSASVVAAEIAMKSNPSAAAAAAQGSPKREIRSRKGDGDGRESLILGELTAEEAAAKGLTDQPVVKKKGRLFSCFGNALGLEVTIVCGASNKKQKND